MKPIKQYTIQTTGYRGGRIVKDVNIYYYYPTEWNYYYPTEWINRNYLWEAIYNMTPIRIN